MKSTYGVNLTEIEEMQFSKYLDNNPKLPAPNTISKDQRKQLVIDWLDSKGVKPIETKKAFAEGYLIFSCTAKDKAEAIEKISSRVYYGSKVNLSMYSVSGNTRYFYLVNSKGDLQRDKIIANTGNRYQLRYFNN